MNRAVYIGGFGNGQESAEAVGRALEPFYDDVDVLTFSTGMAEKDGKVRKMLKGAHAITHSAGVIVVCGHTPEALHTFNGPVPTPRRLLVARTVSKTVQMHAGIRTIEDMKAVAQYDLGATQELTRHAAGNLRYLGIISTFDTLATARLMHAVDGVEVGIALTDDDIYFKPGQEERVLTVERGVPIVDLPGYHDELVLRPEATIAAYFAAIDREPRVSEAVY